MSYVSAGNLGVCTPPLLSYQQAAAAVGWNTLLLGAGGMTSGINIANDNTMMVRSDTAGGWKWNPTAAAPKGNDGSTGAWQQLITSTSMPTAFVNGAQKFNGGVFELIMAPSNSSIVYMIYFVYDPNTPIKSGVYKSTDGGGHWTQLNSFTPLKSSTNFAQNGATRMSSPKMAIHPTNANIVYVGTGASGLFVTTDGGTTWSLVSGIPISNVSPNNEGVTGIVFLPGTPSTIFVSSFGHGIYQSTDSGSTWAQINSGSGPSAAKYAAASSNGNYYVVDFSSNGALWTYSGGTWTENIVGTAAKQVRAVAVDPINNNHIIAVSGKGDLQESLDGSTWNGWSAPITMTPNDVPWLGVLGGVGAEGLMFDQTVSGKLWANASNSVFTTTLTGHVNSGYTPAWFSQARGLEQLNANEIIVAPSAGAKPLCAMWDHGVFSPNVSTYPTTFGTQASTAVCAGWSIDYATSDSSFIAALADGFYAGTAQQSATSTNGGSNWTPLPTLPPTNSFGGNIAVSSDTNFIFGRCAAQPYYTTDGGNTWNKVILPNASGVFNLVNIVSGTYDNSTGLVTLTTDADVGGQVGSSFTIMQSATGSFAKLTTIGGNYTILSGTYDNSTGLVTLTLTTSATFSVGSIFDIPSMTGTGSVSSLTGNKITCASVSGTTVTYNAASGLGAITITGGTLENEDSLEGSFVALSGTSGTTAKYTAPAGLGTITITGGSLNGWSNFIGAYFDHTRVICADRVNANTFYLLFAAVGFFRSTDSGATWSMMSTYSATPPVVPAWGAPVRMKSTPGNAGHLWVAPGLFGNAGHQPAGGRALYQSTDGGATWTAIGTTVEVYDIGFGKAAPGKTYPALYIVGWVGSPPAFGIWKSIDTGVTWTPIGLWPLNMDTISTITGDPNTYGRVYIGFNGTGAAYGDFTT